MFACACRRTRRILLCPVVSFFNLYLSVFLHIPTDLILSTNTRRELHTGHCGPSDLEEEWPHRHHYLPVCRILLQAVSISGLILVNLLIGSDCALQFLQPSVNTAQGRRKKVYKKLLFLFFQMSDIHNQQTKYSHIFLNNYCNSIFVTKT